MPVKVTQLPLRLSPDSSRMITRFFSPGDHKRSREIIERVLAFPEEEIEDRLVELEKTFGSNHPNLRQVFEEHFQQIQTAIPGDSSLDTGPEAVDRCLFYDGVCHRSRSRSSIRRSYRP